jgi:hypothetical protein
MAQKALAALPSITASVAASAAPTARKAASQVPGDITVSGSRWIIRSVCLRSSSAAM